MAKPKKVNAKRRIVSHEKAATSAAKAQDSKSQDHAHVQHTHSSPLVTLERRARSDRRSLEDRRKANVPVAVERRKLERRAKVNRRRQIDPTTCERDYSADELEFMTALDEYKRTSGRMFPTCSEILEVVRNLGYEKRPAKSDGDSSGFEITVADIFCPSTSY
jgi:hypothetical protein